MSVYNSSVHPLPPSSSLNMSDQDILSDNGSNVDNFDYEEQEQFNAGYASEESVSSIVAAPSRRRAALDNYKKSDSGYRQITNGLNTKKSLEFYATSHVPGAYIRNAITGIRYDNHKVGHVSEDLYFKASYAGADSSQHVSAMYYDDPEQFERHMSVHLSDATKTAWQLKYNHACAMLNAGAA